MSDISLGIIGAGEIANEHLRVIKAINGVKVIGITSRTLSKAHELSIKYNIEHIYKSIEDLTNDSNIEGVMVLVSANQIFDVCLNLIPKNKYIFIEKPPGLTLNQTKTLANLADEFSTNTMIGFNRRYYSIFRKGIELIKERGDLLGLVIDGHERFWKIENLNLPLNVIENWIYCNSTHNIDLLRFFGGEVKTINSVRKSIKHKSGDQFVASIEFESGALGTYNAFWWSPGGWSVTLFGNGITVQFKPLEEGIWIDNQFKETAIMPDSIDIDFKPGFYKQMETFVSMIKNDNKEQIINLKESIKTMELARQLSER